MIEQAAIGAAESGTLLKLSPNSDGNWVMPESVTLFTAEFDRDGRDLILETTDGVTARLVGYFNTQDTPDILSHEGATLRGGAVERLAGSMFPGQYAQLGGGIDLADAIGQVETLEGVAFAQRTDGSIVELQIGDKVFQGDVVRTENDGNLSLTFTDGTIFTLAAGSRMVLDELIYDPDSTSNSGVFDLVEGSFVFIAGQTAKTGGIEINTPAATMGIRGTTGLIDIQTVLGVVRVTVSLNVDPDGGLGVIQLFDLNGELISNITATDTKWIVAPPFTGEPPIEIPRSQDELANDSIILNQAADAFRQAIERVANGETFVDLPEGTIEGQTDGPGDEGEGEGQGEGAPPVPPPLDETGDGSGAGESGSGNPELDGTDEPLPEGETGGSDGDEDAGLGGPQPIQTANNNVNAPPQFSRAPIQSFEDTPLTGVLPVSDREGDDFDVSLTRGAENGSVVLSQDGTFTYTPNENFEGEDTFVVSATDSEGNTSEAEIVVVVDSINDAPVVRAARQVAEAAETPEGQTPVDTVLTGVLAYDDVDEGDAPGAWSIVPSSDNTTALGVASIDAATGAWTYVLNQSAANVLSEGQQVVETFVATITDAEGATDVSIVEVTVTGTNDGPVLTSSVEDAQGSLAEAAFGFVLGVEDPVFAGDGDPGSVSGTLTYEDADLADGPAQWTIVANEGNETALGSMAIDPITGTWTYTLDEGAADVLGNDDVVTEMFTATVTDAFGATARQEVTITVTGFNDAPTITFSIEDIQATVTEDGFDADAVVAFAPASVAATARAINAEEADASGQLRYVDPDGQPNETVTWSISPDGPSLGEMTIDPETGEWHYCLDEEAAQSLREGDEVIETFTAVVTDALGASSAQTITITILGANDEAEVEADPDDLEGSVAEDGISTAAGQLNFVDPDAGPEDTATWSVAPVGTTRGSMTIDEITGEWFYTLDQGNAQSLGEGEVAEEYFVASVTDSLGAVGTQTITIFMTGFNDAPVVTSSAVSETVIEEGAAGPGIPSVGGTLTYSDVDVDASTPFWTVTPDAGNTTVLGAMSIDPTTGDWTYGLDQSAADYLQDGEAVTEVFTATITDAFGASDSTTLTIRIEGQNDAPVLSAATAGITEEETEVRINLENLGSDVDAGEDGSTLIYAIVSGPVAGLARLDGNQLVFETNGAFTALALNETQDVEVEVSATDEAGASDTAIVTVTVTGSNGAPTLRATSRTVGEDGPSLNINLAALGDDPDADEDGSTLSYQILSGPAAGTAEIGGTTLTFDPGSDFEDLGANETRDVTVQVAATDNAGETATATMTITVTGTNDAPVLTSDAAAAEDDVTEPGDGVAGDLTAGGTLTYSDSDETVPGEGTWSISPASSTYGQMTIGAGTGQWTYTLNAAAADALAAGETRTETFTARITDVPGDSDTQTVTVTIHGSNDAPTVSATTEEIEEDAGSLQINLAALGDDVDNGESGSTLDYAILSGPASGSARLSGSTLTFDTDGDFSDLGQDEVREVTIRVQAEDRAGATGEGIVTIQVKGQNDAPEITSSLAAASGEVTEPGATTNGALTTGGTLTYVDADASSPTAGEWSVSPTSSALGSISINQVTGVWQYTLNADAADSLDAGDTVTETFTATIEDEQGATDTQEISVLVRGSNDAPTLESTTRTVGEDATSVTVDLRALAADIDGDDTANALSFRITSRPAEGTTTLGSGSVRYSLGDDFQDLREGQEVEVTIGIEVRDPDGATARADVTIAIEGENDGPVITSAASAARGTVTEPGAGVGGALSVGGRLTYEDVDESAPNEGDWSVSPRGSALGSIQINQTTGAWTYTLNAAAADALDAGDVLTEFYTATVEDAFGATDTQRITITIRGTNDAPDLTAASRTLSEDDASATINLAALVDDPDADQAAGDLQFQIISGPADGSASIVNGQLTFRTEGDFDDLPQGGSRNATVQVRATDDAGASDVASYTFIVTGENDAPRITSASSAARGDVVEQGDDLPAVAAVADASGRLTYEDPDAIVSAAAEWTVAPRGGDNLGTMTIDPETGEWHYFLNQTLADSLFEGEEAQQTFTATITDEFGASDSQIITIDITGKNDDPQILASSSLRGDVTEGFQISIGGQINVVDPDDFTTPPSYQIAPVEVSIPAYGSMSINQAGAWTYTVSAPVLETLAQGEMDFETYRVTVTDEFGGQDTEVVRINLTGINTAPSDTSTAANKAGEVIEAGHGMAGTAMAQGTLAYVDPDEGVTSAEWSITPPAGDLLGTMEIDAATGTWTYTLDQEAANLLNAGQKVTETYTAAATDVFNADTGPINVVITINGTNDAPEWDLPTRFMAVPDEATVISLTPHISDPDQAHQPGTLSLEIMDAPEVGSFEILPGTQNLQFTPGDAFADLGADDFEDLEVVIRVKDPLSAFEDQTLTIRVAGENDAPEITSEPGDAMGEISEQGFGTEFSSRVSGQLTYFDSDGNVGGEGEAGGWTISPTSSTLGTININSVTGRWEYRLDQDAANGLDENDERIEEFTARITDNLGEFAETTVKITINGSNDAPDTENDVAQILLGEATDPGEGWSEFGGHYYRYVGGKTTWEQAKDGAEANGAHLATITSAGENAFVAGLIDRDVAWIGANDADTEGVWIWAVGPEAGQQFWQGDVTGSSVGGFYENWNSTEPFAPRAPGQDYAVMRSNGDWDDLSNDPIEFANNFYQTAGRIEEISAPGIVTGDVSTNDSDPEGDGITYALVGDYDGLSMDEDGSWEFDTATTGYEDLAEGELGIVNATYRATDTHGASRTGNLRLEIAGINNAPQLFDFTLANVSEDVGDQQFVVPDIFDTTKRVIDVDSDDDPTTLTYEFSNFDPDVVSISATGNRISFEINSNFDGLDDGDLELITVDVKGTDRWGASDTATLTLGVIGDNDAPVVAAIDAGSVTENAPPVTIDLLDGQTDPDDNDTLSVRDFSYQWVGEGPSPTVTLDEDGKVSFDPGDLVSLDTGETATLNISYKVSDGTVAVANSATIDVTGVSAMTIAKDDDLREQPIDVVIIGTNGAEFEQTAAQLSDSTAYQFNVSTYKAGESNNTSYWNTIFGGADVVLVGGEANPDPGVNGQKVWEVLSDFVSVGTPVVTTGYFHAYVGESPATANAPTRGYLDDISPLSQDQSGFFADNTVDIIASHPIVDGVSDFTLSASDWSLADGLDEDAQSLAIGGAPGPSAIAISDDDARLVYLGGRYLGGNGSLTSLRSGEADQLLEQALNWAADNDLLNNTDENTELTIPGISLLRNDMFSSVSSIANLSGEVSAYSAKGATVTLEGTNVIYDPTTSVMLNNLPVANVTLDTFEYTISDSGTGETSTATVTVAVAGRVDEDNAPTPFIKIGIGWIDGQSNVYSVNPLFVQDFDEGSDITYKFGAGSPDGALPDWLSFDPGRNDLTVDRALHHGPTDQGSLPLFFTAFEEDGQYRTAKFTLNTDGDGSIRFTVYEQYDDAALLEVGLDSGVPLGDGEFAGALIDLSGIDAQAPGILGNVATIDIRNGQKSELVIDPDDLLKLIEGNVAPQNEVFRVNMDHFDTVEFEESADWVINQDESGDTKIEAVAGGVFDDFAEIGAFAAFVLDTESALPS